MSCTISLYCGMLAPKGLVTLLLGNTKNRQQQQYPPKKLGARPTLMGTKNLYENGPNPFFLFGTKNLVRVKLMATVLFRHGFDY